MHTVEMLDHALELAARLGYSVRQEWFAGCGGGACELRGRKLLILDLDLDAEDRLEQAVAALRREPSVGDLPMPPELRDLLIPRKIA